MSRNRSETETIQKINTLNESAIRACIETMNEILRLKELNVELLETLELAMLWFKDYHERTDAPVPNIEVVASLVRKAHLLIDEICLN